MFYLCKYIVVLESPERKKIEDICQPKQKPNDDSTERANILFSTPEHRKVVFYLI